MFLSREFSKNKQKDVFNQSNMIQHPTTMSMLKFRRIRRRRNKQINNNDNNKEKTIVFCRIQKKDEYYLLGRMRNRSRESIDWIGFFDERLRSLSLSLCLTGLIKRRGKPKFGEYPWDWIVSLFSISPNTPVNELLHFFSISPNTPRGISVQISPRI
mgnify:CR=1 FL=1